MKSRGCVPWLQSRIINTLRQAAGGIVSKGELIEACYPDPDREPDGAALNISVTVRFLRRRGFPIKTHYGRGYSYSFREWEIDATLKQVLLSA